VETPLAAFLPSFLHWDHASRKPGLISTGRGIFRQARSSFDAAKDFVPVSLLARFEFGIVVGPEVEAAFQPDRIALQAVHGSASAALFSC